MAKADILAGRAYVSLYVKRSQFTKSLTAAKRDLNEFGSSLVGIGSKVAAAGAGIIGTLTSAVAHFAKAGDELDKMAARTGVSATTLAELGFAAEQSGAGIEDVESAIKRMARNIGDIGPESIKTAEALDAIGLSVSKLQGMSPEDQFQAISERIADIESPTQRAAAAMAVFGEGGRKLLPMLENVRALREEARELGIAPSPESVAAAAQITDAMNRVRRVVGATFYEIGAAMAPIAEDVLGGLLSVVSAVRKFVVENKALVVTAAKVGAVLSIAGTAIVGVGVALVASGAVIGSVLTVMSSLVALFGLLLNPVTLVSAALAVGIYYWVRFSDVGKSAISALASRVMGTFGEISDTVSATIGGIVDAIRGGDLALAGTIAMTGLSLVFAQALDGIHALFGDSIGTMMGQLLSGDFAGAWSTLGSTVLNTWAQVMNGMVQLLTATAASVVDKWRETVDSITNYILQKAADGGVFGKAMEMVLGVNVQEQVAREKALRAKAAGTTATGATGQSDIFSQVANGTYQDPATAAIADRMKAILAEINAGAQSIADSTQAALDDSTAGRGSGLTSTIARLKAELASLQVESIEKAAAMKTSDGGFGGVGGVGGASAASFNLAALAGNVGNKAERLAEKQVNQGDMMLKKLDELMAINRSLGLFHG